jgi:hypothetical protein
VATIEDFYPNKFLKPANVEEDLTVTIDEVGADTIQDDDGTKKKKPILYFKEQVKPLILNRTNFVRIAELAGNETDDWHGTKLILYADTVSMRGKSVATIRVRPAPKAKAAAAAEPAPKAKADAAAGPSDAIPF